MRVSWTKHTGEDVGIWHHEVGRKVQGMAALELDVVKLIAKQTAALLEGLAG
jgi:hypothetical protein